MSEIEHFKVPVSHASARAWCTTCRWTHFDDGDTPGARQRVNYRAKKHLRDNPCKEVRVDVMNQHGFRRGKG